MLEYESMTTPENTSTRIAGKDTPLEQTLEKAQATLKNLGFDIEHTAWRNPVPNCWSVHIRDTNCPALFSNGKGATDKAALASAYGEFIERLASQYFFNDFYLGGLPNVQRRQNRFDDPQNPGVHDPRERWFQIESPGKRPEGLLDDQLWAFYHGERVQKTRDWADLNSGITHQLCALPFKRVRDQQEIYFPVNLVSNLYVSNGLSAGNTFAEAYTQALSEVLERFVKNRVIKEAISLPQIPAVLLDSMPKASQALAALNTNGFTAWALDASLGGRYPVICVLLLDQKSQGVFASFGAHPRFDIALERTLTELVQGRDLDDLHHFPSPVIDRHLAADPDNLELHFIDSSGVLPIDMLKQQPDYSFVHWGTQTQSNEQYFQSLCALIEDDGFDIYIADFPHLGLPACRVLVPGMSEVYPIEELFERNNNLGLAFLSFFHDLNQLTPQQSMDFAQLIEHADLDPLTPVKDVIGLCAEPNSPYFDARIGEFQALALLHAATELEIDSEELIDQVVWLAEVPPVKDCRKRAYRAARRLLELQQNDLEIAQYDHLLTALYGEQELAHGKRLLRGEHHYAPFFTLDLTFSQERRHQTLLHAFHRAYQAKLTFGH